MRKVTTIRHLVVASLTAGALFSACDTKSPVGPSGVTPTTSTTSTTTSVPGPTTSTSSTTTTQVLGSLARRYSAFQAPPNVISEMTLFFELLRGGSPTTATADTSFPGSPNNLDSIYRVTGVWLMGNGTGGTIDGTFTGAVNPLETGGDFAGTFTKTTPQGCTAARPFGGRINPQTLNMAGTGPATGSCVPNPLDIPGFSMFRNDPAAPLPTTSSTSTVFTTSTSTTSVPCSYDVSPTTVNASPAGQTFAINISTITGCAWSSQSFAAFIVANPPQSGAGSGSASFTIGPNTTGSTRVGTLRVAGIQITVTQDTILPDLLPESPTGTSDFDFCRYTTSGTSPTKFALQLRVRNQGTSTAGASKASLTYLLFPAGEPGSVTSTADVPAIAAGAFADITIDEPVAPSGEEVCVNCAFTIMVDSQLQIVESNEANNTRPGQCAVEGLLRVRRGGGPLASVTPGEMTWASKAPRAVSTRKPE